MYKIYIIYIQDKIPLCCGAAQGGDTYKQCWRLDPVYRNWVKLESETDMAMMNSAHVRHSSLGLVVFQVHGSRALTIDGTPSVTDGLNITVCTGKKKIQKIVNLKLRCPSYPPEFSQYPERWRQ